MKVDHNNPFRGDINVCGAFGENTKGHVSLLNRHILRMELNGAEYETCPIVHCLYV